MALVTKMNGEDGTTEGMYTHAFSGIPASQYEFRLGDTNLTVEGLGALDPNDYVGSTFALHLQVKLKGVKKEEISNGTRDVMALKVVNSGPLRLLEKFVPKPKQKKTDTDAAPADPNQATIDDELDEKSADMGDYVPDADDSADKTGPSFSG